jgi:8-oxo-dGTP pyrophosphatase MutT (NUDIX family)
MIEPIGQCPMCLADATKGPEGFVLPRFSCRNGHIFHIDETIWNPKSEEQRPLLGTSLILATRNMEIMVSTRLAKNRHHLGLLQFPGGKVDIGESSKGGLRREVREETGLYFDRDGVGFLGSYRIDEGPIQFVVHAYHTMWIADEPIPWENKEPTKMSDWKLIPIHELMLRCFKGECVPFMEQALTDLCKEIQLRKPLPTRPT